MTRRIGEQTDLWTGVDRLVDRSPSLADLRSHGLHLLAAKRWRTLGCEVPGELVGDERGAALLTITASQVLKRARGAYDGRLIVLKGPEVAARYPTADCRGYQDIDILADDPDRAQRALVAAGFAQGGFEDHYYEGLHHLRPLYLPEMPSPFIEIHRRPNWLEWSEPPGNDELFDAAVPGALDVEGLLALPPAHHALAIAAHSWIELPLRRLLDLVDVLAVSAECPRYDVHDLARQWDMDRVWRTTLAAAESLLLERGRPWSLQIWARNLGSVRDRTVYETHLRRLGSAFWALPPRDAIRATGTALVREVTPTPPESWSSKLRRTCAAVRNPGRPSTEHTATLGTEARRARLKRR